MAPEVCGVTRSFLPLELLIYCVYHRHAAVLQTRIIMCSFCFVQIVCDYILHSQTIPYPVPFFSFCRSTPLTPSHSLRSGTTTRRFVGHTKDVMSVAFSADNRQIVSGSRDHSIKLWNTLGVCKYTIQVCVCARAVIESVGCGCRSCCQLVQGANIDAYTMLTQHWLQKMSVTFAVESHTEKGGTTVFLYNIKVIKIL